MNTLAADDSRLTFVRFFKRVLSRIGVALLLWHIGLHFIDQQLVAATQAELQSAHGAGASLFLFAGLSMLAAIIGPVVSAIAVLFSLQRHENFVQYVANRVTYLVREQMRAMGKVIAWGLLFILPGLWKFLEYSLLPFVVCMDPRYQKGEIDALQTASRVFYRNWGKVILIVFCLMLISLLGTSIDEYRSFALHPFSAVALVTVDLVIFLSFQWLLIRLWENDHAHV